MSESAEFLSAADAAAEVRRALGAGNTGTADRFAAELASRILRAPADATIPDSIFDEPGTTGSLEYDTLLATALAYGMLQRGLAPRDWMSAAAKLPDEWLWDGGYGGSPAFREFIRRNTPEMFLSKNILLRERDLIAP